LMCKCHALWNHSAIPLGQFVRSVEVGCPNECLHFHGPWITARLRPTYKNITLHPWVPTKHCCFSVQISQFHMILSAAGSAHTWWSKLHTTSLRDHFSLRSVIVVLVAGYIVVPATGEAVHMSAGTLWCHNKKRVEGGPGQTDRKP